MKKEYKLKEVFDEKSKTIDEKLIEVFINFLKDIENKKINMVIVKDLSRFERLSSQISYYLDEETFNIAQGMIKSRTSTRVKSYDWLLKGLLICKECGKKLSIVPQKHPNKTTFYN